MPVKYASAAGKPYMPSNGTECMMFEEQWCQKCVKRSTCMIMLTAMDGTEPNDWRFDDNGEPECTSFSDKPSAYRCSTTAELFDCLIKVEE